MKPRPSKALAAVLYAAEHSVSLPDAARKIGVSRQAAHQAAARLAAGIPAGKPGRPRRSTSVASETVRIPLSPTRSVTLRLTPDERTELEQAAGDRPLSEWARETIGKRRPGPAKAREFLLEKARGNG